MEVSSLTVILVAMAIGLIVGFEVGQNVMRKRITEIVEKAAETTRKELEQKRKAQMEAKVEVQKNLEKLAKSFSEIVKPKTYDEPEPIINVKPLIDKKAYETMWERYEEKSKKEQKENGIQSDANN